MARHTETLDGGVWSALDPALLKPGQLSAGRNFVYLAGSPAIYRSWGRDVFGVASATAVDVNGLRDAQFDTGDHIVVALASASYLTAAVGATGTFGVLATGLPGVGSQLEAVQYRNRFFLMPGLPTVSTSAVGTNSVLYVSASGTGVLANLRQHGMAPVSTAPTVLTAAGVFSQTVTGYYEYWTTEVANIQTDGATLALESTFNPPSTTTWVSAGGVVPIIQKPTIVNPITTHWRIYRSAMKSAAASAMYPAGYMIAEVPATGTGAVSAVADSLATTATSYVYPTYANGVGDGATVYAGWVNASAAFTGDNVYASASASDPFYYIGAQGYYGFNFGNFSGTVKGLEVQVKSYVSSGTGPVPLTVFVCPNRKSNGAPQDLTLAGVMLGSGRRVFSKSALVSATSSASPQTITLGSSADSWVDSHSQWPLKSTEFDGNFMVVLQASNLNNARIGVDYVGAKAYYNGITDSTVQFPTVVYTFGDEVSQVGKNGPPPSSSMGDIFQDSLVVNDLSDSSLIRYSYPGSPESFPASYYLNFETRENDAVSMIRVVNNRLIVGLGSSLWRVNYLPSEKDATFDRGKAAEAISRNYGVANPMCCCTFTPDGPTELLAFVSQQGVHYTDGYNFTTLTDGIDWRTDILPTTATSAPIALINDKENQILRFYYRNDSLGNETYMCLPLCYGAGHWVNGTARVGGMLHMRNYDTATSAYAPLKSAWQLNRSSGQVDFLFGYGGAYTAAGAGKVYRETGNTIPANDSTMQFVTRRMYLAGLSKEWRMNEVYGYSGANTAGDFVVYTAKNTKTNGGGEATVGTKTVTLDSGQMHKAQFQQMGEGVRLFGQMYHNNPYRQEFLIIDGENFGLEDSGR